VSGSVLLVHGLASELFSNQVTNDTHHGGTAVVDLNIQLAGLLFRVLYVGSEVSNTVVSVVLGGGHPGQLNKGEEGKDLGESGGGDGTDTIGTKRDVRELQVVRGGQVSIEDNVVVVDDDTDNGSHGNTSVLALNRSAALKGLGLGLQPAQRIVHTKGLGDTKLELTDLEGRGGLGSLGRGESGGGSGKEGGDSELHLGNY